MSSAEQAPFEIRIAPPERRPILIEAAAQVAEQKELTEQERIAMLQHGALHTSSDQKEEQAAQGGPDSEQLKADADTLVQLALDQRNIGYDARQQMARNSQRHEAHVQENLPAYIEAATHLANKDLQRKIGEEVIIHTKANPNIGVMPVSLVNPAVKNDDIAQLESRARPSG